MPRCLCTHSADAHAERSVTLDDGIESFFPCVSTDCPCPDYDPELVG